MKGGMLIILWIVVVVILCMWLGDMVSENGISPIPYYIAMAAMCLPVAAIFYAKHKLTSYNQKIKRLPNYDAVYALEYKPKWSKEEASSDQKSETTGTVQAVFANLVEFTVTINHESFASFGNCSTENAFKPGDQFRVKYFKSGNSYKFMPIDSKDIV